MLSATTADDVRLAVHELGGSGPPLLMAHATGLHGRVWAPVAARLGSRFRCIAVDLRGHGDSGVPPALDFDWRGFGRDVLAVVDELGLQRPFGLGHSCGGAALVLAEQARAGAFRALWCYEPVILAIERPEERSMVQNPMAQAARRRREVFASRREAFENYASKPPYDRVDPEALWAYVRDGFEDLPDGTVRLKCRREDEARVFELGGAHGAYTRLGEVCCPVGLAFGAAQQGPLAEANIEALAGRLPRARVDAMEGLTHFGPLEDPGRVAAAAAAFFASLAAEGVG
ncbi:MAG TPA: alpha/beta hydrolase [Acidimicrobiales bacterium]|nr:alpha/beta hydrolase [Acidimicrobiales bacterium]